MTWLIAIKYLCYKWPFVIITSRSFPRSWLITGFVTTLARQVSLVEQQSPTLPEHLNLPPDFSEVRGTRTLVLYVCFVDRCSTFWTFSFGHCLLFFDIRILISPLVSSNSSSVIVYNSLFRKSRRGICSVARWRSMPIASSTCNAICTQKRYR